MTITASDVKTRFPEFNDIDNARIDIYIAEAERSHNVSQWGGKSDDGLLYLTAHLIATCETSLGLGGGSGPVESEREGQVEVSYAVNKMFTESGGDYGSTKYGRRYMTLLKTIFVTRCT